VPRGRTTPVVLTTIAVALLVSTLWAGLLLDLTDGYDAPETVRFGLSVSPDGQVIVTHRGGPAIDVTNLRIEVIVDGRLLDHQPPVPFFAAQGFRGGPSGPFNSAASPMWRPGERASFQIAETNSPPLVEGKIVRIRLFRDDLVLWEGESAVREGRQ
jgi:hypothetical protein